jgi:hypothetical protein
MWGRLAGKWKLDCLPEIVRFVDLDELPQHTDDILAGRIQGRLAVTIGRKKNEQLDATCGQPNV